MIAFSAVILPVNAQTAEKDSSTRTYYFLAPDHYFKEEADAPNDKVGVYWWSPTEAAGWPGTAMTPAPEVGENVFKIENVPSEASTVIFNNFFDDDPKKGACYQTVMINTEGYSKGECPYSDTLVTKDFNGWIYVLDGNEMSNEFTTAATCNGAWFTLDDYKNHDDYYGVYNFDKVKSIKGDVDDDKSITSLDSLLILRKSVMLEEFTDKQTKLADVDGDNSITSSDALEVLRSSIGLDSYDIGSKVYWN